MRFRRVRMEEEGDGMGVGTVGGGVVWPDRSSSDKGVLVYPKYEHATLCPLLPLRTKITYTLKPDLSCQCRNASSFSLSLSFSQKKKEEREKECEG